MSGFKSHYDLYNRIINKTGGESKFIGLVSKLCGYLEPEQIFNLYETSRENLKEHKKFLTNYHISSEGIIIENESGIPIGDIPLRKVYESYIFSAIVLNVTKLVMNAKLKKYGDALNEALGLEFMNDIDYYIDIDENVLSKALELDTVIKDYIINTGSLFTKRSMLKKINTLRADKNANISEKEYLEGVYAEELKLLSDSCSEVYSSIFHTGIPQKTDAEGMLAKHYSSDETAINTEKILNTKNAFLDYLERNASDLNNYGQIMSLTEATKNILLFQEAQEIGQKRDWELTEAVLDFVCPKNQYNTIAEFFSNRYVGMYITPTPIGRGKLYVRALEKGEIKDMAEYLIENISHGRIKAGMKDKMMKHVCAIMPKGCAIKIKSTRVKAST